MLASLPRFFRILNPHKTLFNWKVCHRKVPLAKHTIHKLTHYPLFDLQAAGNWAQRAPRLLCWNILSYKVTRCTNAICTADCLICMTSRCCCWRLVIIMLYPCSLQKCLWQFGYLSPYTDVSKAELTFESNETRQGVRGLGRGHTELIRQGKFEIIFKTHFWSSTIQQSGIQSSRQGCLAAAVWESKILQTNQANQLTKTSQECETALTS